MPVQAPTHGHLFYGYSEKPSHLVGFYDMLGKPRRGLQIFDTRVDFPVPVQSHDRFLYSHLTPRGTHGDCRLRGAVGFEPGIFRYTRSVELLELINIDHVKWCEVNFFFNVTVNNISVIYVTAHRCAGGLKKKFDLRSGSQRHRHFVGFFIVPVQAPTRGHPFIRTAPFSRPLRHSGDTEDIFST